MKCICEGGDVFDWGHKLHTYNELPELFKDEYDEDYEDFFIENDEDK